MHIEILARERGGEKNIMLLLFEVAVCIGSGGLQMTSVLRATLQHLNISLAH